MKTRSEILILDAIKTIKDIKYNQSRIDYLISQLSTIEFTTSENIKYGDRYELINELDSLR